MGHANRDRRRFQSPRDQVEAGRGGVYRPEGGLVTWRGSGGHEAIQDNTRVSLSMDGGLGSLYHRETSR